MRQQHASICGVLPIATMTCVRVQPHITLNETCISYVHNGTHMDSVRSGRGDKDYYTIHRVDVHVISGMFR